MTISIKLSNISVKFNVPAQERPCSKSSFSLFNHTTKKEVFALKNISLEINEGERVGLLGHNGAGKSTLLRVMAGIYHPTTGSCDINGHINPMFELATGVELEMSGWENMKIRALLLGMTDNEFQTKIDSIAEFSGLGEALNYPVKTYSSGMFMRLAFSVSTAIEPQILLMDEVVAAGDASFEMQAQKRLTGLMEKGKILVITSHNMDYLSNTCDRLIWLEKGSIVGEGEPSKVIESYLARVRNEG